MTTVTTVTTTTARPDLSLSTVEYLVFTHSGVTTKELIERLGERLESEPGIGELVGRSPSLWRDANDRWWLRRQVRQLSRCWQIQLHPRVSTPDDSRWDTVRAVRIHDAEDSTFDVLTDLNNPAWSKVDGDAYVLCRPHPLSVCGPW